MKDFPLSPTSSDNVYDTRRHIFRIPQHDVKKRQFLKDKMALNVVVVCKYCKNSAPGQWWSNIFCIPFNLCAIDTGFPTCLAT